ncbi:hypothetical protein GGQ84_002535 [Desulfitispora alkaliphila]|uniref:extracellular matrix regulator RemB n=1 Tax=Desulfitispora alkaliphila TaxID=622674 RepID=UPI003D20A37F
MFLHIGGDVAVPIKQIIAIVNVETGLKRGATQEYFQIAEEEGFLERTTQNEKIKSYVITDEKVFLSPISSFTLLKRANMRKKVTFSLD